MLLFFFFFNDTATTEIYTLSLHDALPISDHGRSTGQRPHHDRLARVQAGEVAQELVRELLRGRAHGALILRRSEEHTSELQSRQYLVCRLLLEKKKICMPHHRRLRACHRS